MGVARLVSGIRCIVDSVNWLFIYSIGISILLLLRCRRMRLPYSIRVWLLEPVLPLSSLLCRIPALSFWEALGRSGGRFLFTCDSWLILVMVVRPNAGKLAEVFRSGSLGRIYIEDRLLPLNIELFCCGCTSFSMLPLSTAF